MTYEQVYYDAAKQRYFLPGGTTGYISYSPGKTGLSNIKSGKTKVINIGEGTDVPTYEIGGYGQSSNSAKDLINDNVHTTPQQPEPDMSSNSFYIDTKTGAQLSKDQLVAGQSYIESGTGKSYVAPTTATGGTTPVTAVQPTGAQPLNPAQQATPAAPQTPAPGGGQTITDPVTGKQYAWDGTTYVPVQNATGAPTTQGNAPVSTYTGPSVVDYLNSVGQPSSFAARAQLAAQAGIQNYSGTAEQNTRLLSSLRGNAGTAQTPAAPQVSSPAPTEAPSAAVNTPSLAQYGVSAPDPTKNPIVSFQDTYKSILNSLGVASIKQQFDQTNSDFEALQRQKSQEARDINDDPWLSEGVRVSKLRQLDEKYKDEELILTNKIKIYDSQYQTAIDEAKFVANQAFEQYQFDTNLQLKLYDMAQEAYQAEQELAAKANDIDTQVVDVGGRKKLINSKTGATIADLGASSSGSGSSKGTITSGTLSYTPNDQAADSQALNTSRGQDGYVDPTLYLNLYNAWIAGGGTLEDFLKTYPPKNYVNPANTWLPSYLKPKATGLEGEIESLF